MSFIKDLFFRPAKNSLIEFIRSLFVGGTAFIVDFATLALLKEVAGVSTLTASTLGFVAGVVVNYLLSVFWAFKSSNIKSPFVRFIVFVSIAVAGLLMNNLIINFFDKTLAEKQVFGSFISSARYYLIGKIAATITVFFWNFFSRKLLLFRGEKQETESDKDNDGA